jgi:enoyl-CoA hydratase
VIEPPTPKDRCSSVQVSRTNGAAWIHLTRAGSGNRIDASLAHALCELTEDLEFDESIAVVVVAASGDAFCLGVEEGGVWEQRADWVQALATLSRPVVAVIQGDAVAEGCEMALACDLRVVSTRARFALPQLREGRLPRHGGTQRLPRLVGRMRALDMILTGRIVDASEAQAIGLVSRVAAPDELEATAHEVVAGLCRMGPIALRYAKEAILKGADMPLDQGIRLEEDLYVLLQTTADRREGVEAFLARRRPIFRGQ